MNVRASMRGPGGSGTRGAGVGEICRTATVVLVPYTCGVPRTRCRTIPIFKRGDTEPEQGPEPGPESSPSSSSDTTPAATETTQDIVADWDGTLRDGTVVRSGWFGGDSAFTVALIASLSVISTLFLTHGVGRFKHSKATRELRQRVKVDAPVTPREATAQKYPTGWSMDEPSYASTTVDNSGYAEQRGSAGRLPLRGPDGERARNEYMEAEREKYEDFRAMVDGIGKPTVEVGREEEGFDMFSDDDYARGSRMTFREMKERANKASESAARAAAHAHQASIASTIASEACNEATAAAHRALQASMKTQRALERSSGQHIMEIYEATKKEEAIAERRARVAAEMSARGMIEEFKAGKASRKAVDAADASRPHGLVNLAKAWSYEARAFLSSVATHGREAALQSKTMLQRAAEASKGIAASFKQHIPLSSSG